MMASIGTVGVKCPRCDSDIKCALEGEIALAVPGVTEATMNVRVTDLADRFSEHYVAAGHVEMP